MKKLFLILSMAVAAIAGAENLIRNPECDGEAWKTEFRLMEGAGRIELSQFVEPATWNRCLKMELKGYAQGKDGFRRVNGGIVLGGDARNAGFECKPGTLYRFKMEVRGEADRAMINFYQWDGKGKAKKQRTDIHLIRPQKEWTVYRGTFRTSAEAKRAALFLQFWGDEKVRDLKEKPGQYVLIDKVVIEEADDFRPGSGAKESLPKVMPAAVFIAGNAAKNAAVIPEFRDLMEDRPAKLRTEAKIYRSGKALKIRIDCFGPVTSDLYQGEGGQKIWQDDLVEIFLESVDRTTPYRQFVVSAGNGRWMGNGTPGTPDGYSLWKSEVKRFPDCWSVEAEIPFAALGYVQAPADGESLRFNLCRQHPAPGTFPVKPDYSKGNRWGGGMMFDNSSCIFGRGSNQDMSRFAVLFLGSMKPFCDRAVAGARQERHDPVIDGLIAMIRPEQPGTAFAAAAELEKRLQYLKLAKEPFLLARISPSCDPAVPFFPKELRNAEKLFRIRAAVNEQAPLALALANMTALSEEYRVFIHSGWARQDASQEWGSTVSGLRSDGGGVFPASRIELRRGVPVRDADSPKHERRLDILARLNEAGTVPVAPREAGLLWLTFDCSGVKPGVYKGRISVLPLNGENRSFRHGANGTYDIQGASKEFAVELEVLPIVLPERSPMPFNSYARPLRDDQCGFLDRYDGFMYMFTPWYFSFRYHPDGSVAEYSCRSFMEPQLKRVVEGIRRSRNISDPKLMIGYSVYPVWKKNFVPKQIRFDTPEYWNAWRNFCLGIDGILQKHGISRREYTMEIFDEPSVEEYPVPELERAHLEYKKAMPDASITMTSGISYIDKPELFERIAPNIDIWIFTYYRTNLADYRKKMEKFQALPGKKSGTYACGTSMRQELYRYYRLLPWNALESGCDFVSLYQMFPQHALGNDLYKIPYGDVAYILPDTILPSLRLENLRIGLTDVKYMKLLEQIAAKRNTPVAAEAREFLRKAAREVYVVYPHDSARAEQARVKAQEYIVRLKQ